MGNIWHIVTHPDNSICVGHRYEEDMTVIEFAPSRVWEKRMWFFLTFLFIFHFLTILAFSHTIVFVAAPLSNLAFALAVICAKTPVITVGHLLYSIMVNIYAVVFHDYYMFCVSVTYIITYTISLKMTNYI